MCPLSELTPKKQARIVGFTEDSWITSCCIEMGLCENSIIEIVDYLPFGNHLIVLSENGKYVLRKQEVCHILVEVL